MATSRRYDIWERILFEKISKLQKKFERSQTSVYC